MRPPEIEPVEIGGGELRLCLPVVSTGSTTGVIIALDFCFAQWSVVSTGSTTGGNLCGSTTAGIGVDQLLENCNELSSQ